jgi:hypothetical protein
MPAILIITDEAQRALLIKACGGIPSPSFAAYSVLSSLDLFATEEIGITLDGFSSTDMQTRYKRFGCLLFILVTNNTLLENELLENVFQGLHYSLVMNCYSDMPCKALHLALYHVESTPSCCRCCSLAARSCPLIQYKMTAIP